MANALILVRHGVIQANLRGHWHGSTDSPLLWRGRRQARRVARRLATMEPLPTTVYTSPLQRCQRTAHPIAKRLDSQAPTVVDDLREYAIGEWEDMRFADLAKEHNFVAKAAQDNDFAPPGGESIREVAARIIGALQDIDAQHGADERVVIVSHGAALAIALASLLDADPSQWPDYHLDNCSVTELVLGNEAYVNEFNCTKHL